MKIDQFRGKYYFLSNFYSAPVFYQNLRFKNNEAAFQAMKVLDVKIRETFTQLEPNEAKRKGRKVRLRPDWETVKETIMYEICKAKFEQNPALRSRLLETGDAELVEGNTWNDRTWGVCEGKGENKLGKILMRIRDEMKTIQ